MATQIHIKMLGRKTFSPLHEQTDFIAFQWETGSLQSTGSILYRFTTVADSQRNMKQHRINIHTFDSISRRCPRKTGGNNFFTKLLYLLNHRLQLRFIVNFKQAMWFNQDNIPTQRLYHPFSSGFEIILGIHTQSHNQTGRKQMSDFSECGQRLFRTKPKHICKQRTCK